MTPLRITLAKRLLTFRQSIQKSDKSVLKQILNIVESDVRTVTGRNVRSILILTDKSSVQQLHRSDLEIIRYYGEPEQWQLPSRVSDRPVSAENVIYEAFVLMGEIG